MPKKFIKVEREIEKKMKQGLIPIYYYKHGVKYKSNPYAIARKVTGYHGTTCHKGSLYPKNRPTELRIKGKPNYISKMFTHLKKEHPSTRRRMKII